MLLKFFETLFYFIYIPVLAIAGVILILISSSYPQFLSGVMALFLLIAEVFFIFPRVSIIWHKRTIEKAINMGRGRQINSILFTFVFLKAKGNKVPATSALTGVSAIVLSSSLIVSSNSFIHFFSYVCLLSFLSSSS